MKKILILIVLILITSLSGCFFADQDQPDNDTPTTLDIYYLNDLHGAIEKSSGQHGLSGISAYLNSKRLENPKGVILLGGGDMLQGSALSNYYQGRSTLQLMQVMGFDAMVTGNHEFDWGIEVVTAYFNEEKFLSFPLLGANIYHRGTQDLIDGIDPYTIITRGNLKIGVIGTMGYGL